LTEGLIIVNLVGGHPYSAHECVNQLEDLGGDQQTKNDKSPILLSLSRGFMSAMSLHTFLILEIRSASKSK